jgi:hypothetical protein
VVRIEGDVAAVGVGDAEGRRKVVVARALRVVPVRERVDVDLALDVRPLRPVHRGRVPVRPARYPPRHRLVPELHVLRQVLELVNGDLSLCCCAAFDIGSRHNPLVDAGVTLGDVDVVLVRHGLLLNFGHDGVRALLLGVLLPDALDGVVRHEVPRRHVSRTAVLPSCGATPGLPDRDALHHQNREQAEAPEAKDRRAEQDEEPVAVPQRGHDAPAAAGGTATTKLGLEPPRWC